MASAQYYLREFLISIAVVMIIYSIISELDKKYPQTKDFYIIMFAFFFAQPFIKLALYYYL